MTISAVADRAGLTPDTLRYYERIGLIPPPERSESGYRLFDEAVSDRLAFIKGAQRVGLRLRDIKELLDVMDRGLCPCGHTEALLQTRLLEIGDEIARLSRLKEDLTNLVEGNRPDACPTEAPWPCATQLLEVGRR